MKQIKLFCANNVNYKKKSILTKVMIHIQDRSNPICHAHSFRLNQPQRFKSKKKFHILMLHLISKMKYILYSRGGRSFFVHGPNLRDKLYGRPQRDFFFASDI